MGHLNKFFFGFLLMNILMIRLLFCLILVAVVLILINLSSSSSSSFLLPYPNIIFFNFNTITTSIPKIHHAPPIFPNPLKVSKYTYYHYPNTPRKFPSYSKYRGCPFNFFFKIFFWFSLSKKSWCYTMLASGGSTLTSQTQKVHLCS